MILLLIVNEWRYSIFIHSFRFVRKNSTDKLSLPPTFSLTQPSIRGWDCIALLGSGRDFKNVGGDAWFRRHQLKKRSLPRTSKKRSISLLTGQNHKNYGGKGVWRSSLLLKSWFIPKVTLKLSLKRLFITHTNSRPLNKWHIEFICTCNHAAPTIMALEFAGRGLRY